MLLSTLFTRFDLPAVSRPVRLTDFADLIAVWKERVNQRQHLRELDDRMLEDIGLTRADVARETSKPFWLG